MPHMPQDLRANLLDLLDMVFPNILKQVDSESEGIDHTFPSFLFSWYNRYCADVCFYIIFIFNIF